MQQHSTAAPGAPAGDPSTDRTAAIRAIVAHPRPTFGPPLDGTAAPAAPVGAPPAAPAADPLGLGAGPAPASSTSDSTAPVQVTHTVGPTAAHPGIPAGQTPPAPTPPAPAPVVAWPAPAPPQQTPPPATAVPAQPTPPVAPPGQGDPAAAAAGDAMDTTPLEQFPPELRSYIASLRKEAGDNRIKAKTAEERAGAALDEAKRDFAETLFKQLGFIADPAEQAEQSTPEQRLEQATVRAGQLADTNRALVTELAIWKGAAAHGADPQRLTDSRAFMTSVAALDAAAADYDAQLAAAVKAAVDSNPYYSNTPPAPPAPIGQAPAVPAPLAVPSGGDFGGGPAGHSTQPQTVDDYRELLRKSRAANRG